MGTKVRVSVRVRERVYGTSGFASESVSRPPSPFTSPRAPNRITSLVGDLTVLSSSDVVFLFWVVMRFHLCPVDVCVNLLWHRVAMFTLGKSVEKGF